MFWLQEPKLAVRIGSTRHNFVFDIEEEGVICRAYHLDESSEAIAQGRDCCGHGEVGLVCSSRPETKLAVRVAT